MECNVNDSHQIRENMDDCTLKSLLSSGADSPLHRAAAALREAPGGYGGAVHFPEAI